MTRVLQNKIKDAGGTIASKASEAEVVVIDPSLAESVVRRDFLKGDKAFDAALKVRLDWLREVLNSGTWIDPKDPAYAWRQSGESTSSGDEISRTANMVDEESFFPHASSSSEAAESPSSASSLPIIAHIDSRSEDAMDSPRQVSSYIESIKRVFNNDQLHRMFFD